MSSQRRAASELSALETLACLIGESPPRDRTQRRLNQLARAVGADDNWWAHLTVAYGYQGQAMPEFLSSPWQPSEAVLVSSADGVYTPVARVGLRTSARR